MLLDLLFGGRVDDSDVGLDDDVGYEGAVGGGTETWFLVLSETGLWGGDDWVEVR